MKNEWTWQVAITAIVAIYGAVLATVNMIINWAEKQPHLSIVFKSGFIVNSSTSGYLIVYAEASSSVTLFVEIANMGSKTVIIKGVDINANKKFKPIFKMYNPIGGTLPYTLEEGKNCAAGIDIKDLAKSLIQNGQSGKIKLLAYVTSGTGKIYKSKKAWILNLDEYNKQ